MNQDLRYIFQVNQEKQFQDAIGIDRIYVGNYNNKRRTYRVKSADGAQMQVEYTQGRSLDNNISSRFKA